MEEKTESATPDNGVKISFGRKELESYSFLFDAIEDRTLRLRIQALRTISTRLLFINSRGVSFLSLALFCLLPPLT